MSKTLIALINYGLVSVEITLFSAFQSQKNDSLSVLSQWHTD